MPGVNRSADRHLVAGLHSLDAPGIAVPESLIAPEAPRTRTVIDRCRRIEVARPIAVVGAVGLSLARKQRAAGRAGGSTGARITPPEAPGFCRARACDRVTRDTRGRSDGDERCSHL